MDEKLLTALTFDDGPSVPTTSEVLDVLERHSVRASFFPLGNNICGEGAEALRRAYESGCEICSHGRTHTAMTELSAEEIRAELAYTDEKLRGITGKSARFFRPPYLAIDQRVIDSVSLPLIAGLGCDDWNDEVSAEQRVRVILDNVKDGDIILLHDMQGNSRTVEALGMLIPELKAMGFGFVTVSELFEKKGVEPVRGRMYSNVFQTGLYG